MRVVLVVAGTVALAASLLRWGEWQVVVTIGSAGTRTPSSFEVNAIEHLRLTASLLAVVALLCAAYPRRAVAAASGVVLALGAAWLARWQLNPPVGTLISPPFAWPLWLCVSGLAVSSVAAAWMAFGSRSSVSSKRWPRRLHPQRRPFARP